MIAGPCQRCVDTPTRCYYADDPTSRPHCTLTVAVRYGAVPLCRPCQAARSTLGKGDVPVTVISPEIDVLDWIDISQQRVGAAEHTLAAAVIRARQAGHSWTTIGAQLGISRQAAQQRFTRNAPLPPRASVRESTKGTTRAS